MTSLRNLPIVAEYGYGLVSVYLLVAITFLFPSAFISAELATGWNRTGGIYIWVREAFGPAWGFFAVWMQWVHNVTWFPAILSFSASALAYLIDPSLIEHKGYLVGMTLGGFWGFTLFNFLGLKHSSWFSSIGVIAGTIIPGFMLIALGTAWALKGNPIAIQFQPSALIPPLNNLQNLVFVTGLFLAFGGLEVSAVHAREVKNPQRDLPRAILIAGLLSLAIYMTGALAIAIMIPAEKISLVSGLMKAFELFFQDFGLEWLLIPMGVMIVFGAIGELNAWIIGPVRALHATSIHGDLPPLLQKLNRHRVPVNLLLFQGIIVSLASLVFLCMPSASSAFWILSVISAQIYLVMYVLMFLAAIKLRYSHPEIPRAYRVPYGKPGIWFIGLLGTISSGIGFLVGFVPPGQLQVGNLYFYEGFLVLGLFFMCLIPYLIYRYKDPSWNSVSKLKEETHEI